MVRDQQYLILLFYQYAHLLPRVLLESTISVVDCDKDGINVAVALIIISNAVNESQASIVYSSHAAWLHLI
jgi:hypothetical protein